LKRAEHRKIFNSRAPNLKGNYAVFYSAWQKEFTNKKDEIFQVCKSEKFPTEEWFIERVFDFYLWING
jgi:hypothetical protein